MNCREKFLVEPDKKVRLNKIDPSYTGKFELHEDVAPTVAKHLRRMSELQYLLYANANPSLLVVLQGLDAAGKDGVIRHIFSGMNPQGVSVAAYKQPSKIESEHDFLWRVHQSAPAKGEIVIFNRSHYEDVLVVRVHDLVPRAVWSKRYDMINDFETLLIRNNTHILKFYLHISPQEQLQRFEQRLDDPMRQWKISESDYSERKLWPDYVSAYEEAIRRTSTKQAPWYIIPSNHKWFRDYAISDIITATLEDLELKLPPTRVNLADIRRKYHAAQRTQSKGRAKSRGRK
jgi:PPK2 family polyphosphate:nucleotide phosphotransferase